MSQPQFRQLPVKLTEKERMARATTAAEKQREIGQIETQKKEVSSELGRKLKDLRKEIETIQRAVLTGSEDQKVQIEHRRNEERRTIETVRLDTGDVIDTRPMTFEERQGKLALDPEKKSASKKSAKRPSKAKAAGTKPKPAGAKAKKSPAKKKAASKRYPAAKASASKKKASAKAAGAKTSSTKPAVPASAPPPPKATTIH